ncbi:MAG: hypothetical protein PHR43_01420 [Dehalococcoidales bacterium]|nr:hypothetical protein [Dehalococcoidales bacterium]
MNFWQSTIIITVLLILFTILTACEPVSRESYRQQQQEYYRQQCENILREFQRQQDAQDKAMQEFYQAYADNLSHYFQQQHENEQALLEQQIKQAQQQQ